MDDWSAQHIIVGVLGFIAMLGLVAALAWAYTHTND